ncbi:MAG TPA: ABC transporter permease, partial [Gemmatimonadaceae bacterium]|nr:ABC transporter permease [Gemmatimonadaceae bacterium]
PLEAFLEGTIRTASPLGFAALGETVTERGGVINIGLEGAIIAGAFGGFVAAGTGSVTAGFVGAGICGAATAALFCFFAIRLRTDQIITGTAISLLSLGLTATLYRQFYGATGAALSIPTLTVIEVPVLASIPLIGRALFAQPPVTYLLYLLVPTTWWWMYRTHSGLALRAVGENPRAALAAGITPARIQALAVMFGGSLGGIAGGFLVLAQAGSFSEGMSAGRGFMGIAIVVLGRWHPLGVAAAAVVFGAASALQYFFQAMGWSLPYQAFLALPYVLTLLGLAGMAGRVTAPASLGHWKEQE